MDRLKTWQQCVEIVVCAETLEKATSKVHAEKNEIESFCFFPVRQTVASLMVHQLIT